MDEPRSLDSLFKEKLFRIPDYQRGYAWQIEQLKAFWEDLVNLSAGRSHYTGVLTLKQIPADDINESDKEYWLVDDHSYKLHHIVDGQQRLTTFVVFLQAFLNLVESLPEHDGQSADDIYISDSLSVAAVRSKYLFKLKPTGDRFRTYKFGYTIDNPSDRYLRHRILDEPGGGSVAETFYTLNLNNAKRYFAEQLREVHEHTGMAGLQDLYKKLTKRFLFNEYIIKDEFDVFVAFETMNNRGKKLSDLELLKNRLIYLTTLYDDQELDAAERKSLRDTVNDAWKEVYHQLGRNKTRPLNDDDFLRAHWTMYFKYSRQTGRDYIRFLLEEQFTPQKVHKKVVHDVALEAAHEQTSSADFEDEENGDGDVESDVTPTPSAQLRPTEIRDFVLSLRESSVHWFNSFYPHLAETMSIEERKWIERLNRIGMVYFRPLVMAILKSVSDEADRARAFQRVEQFIFIVFRLTTARANYRSSEFYNAARAVDSGELDMENLAEKLLYRMAFAFNDDATLRSADFANILFKKFKAGSGYYSWTGLRYFLYEYELSLLSASRQKKVDWEDLLRTAKDRISIEHIYPQTATDDWESAFKGIDDELRPQYAASLGNFLLLSQSINSSLQNDSFELKKSPKVVADGRKVRNGYSDGSHSEIEVSTQAGWGPDEIRDRGLRLLKFMERRWCFQFKDDEERESLLFLSPLEDA
ncbi:MAG: DUF262 domain-containing HNH endonuclease family protein [Phycisphaerales bacterium]|nr:DUF262 domain-containing HNH endonuclease family protein [Phycisphaerales bacterium]